jgi:hypothetical protein
LSPPAAPGFESSCARLSPPRCLTCPLGLQGVQWAVELVVVRASWPGHPRKSKKKKKDVFADETQTTTSSNRHRRSLLLLPIAIVLTVLMVFLNSPKPSTVWRIWLGTRAHLEYPTWWGKGAFSFLDSHEYHGLQPFDWCSLQDEAIFHCTCLHVQKNYHGLSRNQA